MKKERYITSSFPCGCFWNQLMFIIYSQTQQSKNQRLKKKWNNPKGLYKRERIIDLNMHPDTSMWVKWTWISAEGEGVFRLSERDPMAHISARIVTANVSRAFNLYPNECIFSSSFTLFTPTAPQRPVQFLCLVGFQV